MRDFWNVDDNTVVFVADPSLGMNLWFWSTNSIYYGLNFLDILLTPLQHQLNFIYLH